MIRPAGGQPLAGLLAAHRVYCYDPITTMDILLCSVFEIDLLLNLIERASIEASKLGFSLTKEHLVPMVSQISWFLCMFIKVSLSRQATTNIAAIRCLIRFKTVNTYYFKGTRPCTIYRRPLIWGITWSRDHPSRRPQNGGIFFFNFLHFFDGYGFFSMFYIRKHQQKLISHHFSTKSLYLKRLSK